MTLKHFRHMMLSIAADCVTDAIHYRRHYRIVALWFFLASFLCCLCSVSLFISGHWWFFGLALLGSIFFNERGCRNWDEGNLYFRDFMWLRQSFLNDYKQMVEAIDSQRWR